MVVKKQMIQKVYSKADVREDAVRAIRLGYAAKR